MTDSPTISDRQLIGLVASRFGGGMFILALLFFLPAGTLAYWPGWLYLGTLSTLMLLMMRYLWRNDKALLQRRMQMREKRTAQQKIIALGSLFFLIIFALPGLDYRLGWSNLPTWAILLADLGVILGYGLFAWVMAVNSYAARTVEIITGQKVITTGPYAIVRHPMYAGAILLYLASPLALGSYWAFFPTLLIIPILVARIINEEKMLVEELPGYAEYRQKTRYRLLPGVW